MQLLDWELVFTIIPIALKAFKSLGVPEVPRRLLGVNGLVSISVPPPANLARLNFLTAANRPSPALGRRSSSCRTYGIKSVPRPRLKFTRLPFRLMTSAWADYP